MINSENHFRGFTAYFDKKIGQKLLFRLFLHSTIIQEMGAVDGGSVNAFLAVALTRVMRATIPIPVLTSASVLHSAAVGGSVVGVMGPL